MTRLIIFDWDDTLFPSRYMINEPNDLSKNDIEYLEQSIIYVLEEAMNHGTVYILTNATKEWFYHCIETYCPKLKNIIINRLKIKDIIFARVLYSVYYNEEDIVMWKSHALFNIIQDYPKDYIKNIIFIADQKNDFLSIDNLLCIYNKIDVDKYKYKDNPTLYDVTQQHIILFRYLKDNYTGR
jgi:hypothetical protein